MLKTADTVYVPCSRLAGLPEQGTALYRTKIAQVRGKTVTVDLPEGCESDWIGKSLVHKDVGILIINIGDLESEITLLDPLAKSIKQFCKLIVGDDHILSRRVRSLDELSTLWKKEQGAYSHVIWIGHGSKTALKFGAGGWKDVQEIGKALKVWNAPRKVYISLCCETGYSTFGGNMSKETICSEFIGSRQSVNGAVASQFCQTFFNLHFLEGQTVAVAFRNAKSSILGGSNFYMWRSGKQPALKRRRITVR